MLVVRDLSKSYGGGPHGRRVLAGIDLELAAGEYIAIIGESGIGKSTLLNLIAGLDVPDSGSIRLDGADLARLSDDARTRLRRTAMGFVFQAFHLLPYLTIKQNVALPLNLGGMIPAESDRRAMAMLEAVGLVRLADAYPRQLSGGEMQRTAIARALVHRPQLILADEPTGNLDPENAAHAIAVLRQQIKAGGGAGILVTHSAAAAATTDRVYVLTPDGLRTREPAS